MTANSAGLAIALSLNFARPQGKSLKWATLFDKQTECIAIKLTDFPYFVYFRDDGEGFLVMLVINAAREPALIQSLLGERS